VRSPASISRYSRTLTPTNQAARQTLRPSRFRARCIIPVYAAEVGPDGAYRWTRTTTPTVIDHRPFGAMLRSRQLVSSLLRSVLQTPG
jgi:hypothetical protein